MKKLLAMMLVLSSLLCFPIPCPSETDADAQCFYIDYAMYDGMELFGSVEIPDGVYFIRATFFMRNGTFCVVIVPISREGLFQLQIAIKCKYAIISIVDSPSAIVPGEGKIYETKQVQILGWR